MTLYVFPFSSDVWKQSIYATINLIGIFETKTMLGCLKEKKRKNDSWEQTHSQHSHTLRTTIIETCTFFLYWYANSSECPNHYSVLSCRLETHPTTLIEIPYIHHTFKPHPYCFLNAWSSIILTNNDMLTIIVGQYTMNIWNQCQIKEFGVKCMDQCMFLGNCPPIPPQTWHFAQSEKC